MQRESNFPFHRHFVDGRFFRCVQPALADALFQGFALNFGIVRIKEYAQLCFVQVLRVFHGSGFFDLVGVIQQHAQIADAAYAGFGAYGRFARFDARIAENTFFGFTANPVVVDFFVRAAGNTHTPAAAFVLVDEHDAVVFAFVDASGRAGCNAGRVQAVFAQTRQIHHKGLLECAHHFFLDAFKQGIFGALFKFAGQIVFPVRAPFNLVHFLAGEHGNRPRSGRGFHARGILQVLVVVGERLVVVVDLRQVGVGENVGQDFQTATLLGHELAVGFAHPAAVPFFLVFPVFREADTGLGFNIVEPGVFHAVAACPYVFAGNGAGVAADTFVQVQHHADLCSDFHDVFLK